MFVIAGVLVLLIVAGVGLAAFARRSRSANETRTSDSWLGVAGEMVAGIRSAALRFPVTGLLLAVLALHANFSVADLLPDHLEEWRLTAALFSAATLSLAGTLLAEARGWSAGKTQALAFLLALQSDLKTIYIVHFFALRTSFESRNGHRTVLVPIKYLEGWAFSGAAIGPGARVS